MAFATLVSLHILFAGLFSGTNVYLDFVLTPKMNALAPGQALRLGDRVGTRVAVLTLGSLVGLPVTGLLLLHRYGMWHALFTWPFYTTGYGAALGLMMTIWLTVMVSGLLMMFYFRPRVVVKVPLDCEKEEVTRRRDRGIELAKWMRRLATYNAVMSFVAILTGSIARYGGF